MTNLARKGPLGLKQPIPVSHPLRQAARGERCTLRLWCCNHDPETTVLAHIRMFGWAGMAQKPPRYLRPGDVAEVEIDEIGTLRNKVV